MVEYTIASPFPIFLFSPHSSLRGRSRLPHRRRKNVFLSMRTIRGKQLVERSKLILARRLRDAKDGTQFHFEFFRRTAALSLFLSLFLFVPKSATWGPRVCSTTVGVRLRFVVHRFFTTTFKVKDYSQAIEKTNLRFLRYYYRRRTSRYIYIYIYIWRLYHVSTTCSRYHEFPHIVDQLSRALFVSSFPQILILSSVFF